MPWTLKLQRFYGKTFKISIPQTSCKIFITIYLRNSLLFPLHFLTLQTLYKLSKKAFGLIWNDFWKNKRCHFENRYLVFSLAFPVLLIDCAQYKSWQLPIISDSIHTHFCYQTSQLAQPNVSQLFYHPTWHFAFTVLSFILTKTYIKSFLWYTGSRLILLLAYFQCSCNQTQHLSSTAILKF